MQNIGSVFLFKNLSLMCVCVCMCGVSLSEITKTNVQHLLRLARALVCVLVNEFDKSYVM